MTPVLLDYPTRAGRHAVDNAVAAILGLKLRVSVLTGQSDVGSGQRAQLRKECLADFQQLSDSLDVLRSILTRQENER